MTSHYGVRQYDGKVLFMTTKLVDSGVEFTNSHGNVVSVSGNFGTYHEVVIPDWAVTFEAYGIDRAGNRFYSGQQIVR